MMSLSCITIPSVEVPHFDENDFVSCKSQMSSYLRESSSLVDGRYRYFSYLGGLSSNTRVKEMSISRSPLM
jgi:hypothetical protein